MMGINKIIPTNIAANIDAKNSFIKKLVSAKNFILNPITMTF